MSRLLEWLWFAHMTGVGASNTAELLALYTSPAGLLAAMSCEDVSPYLTRGQMTRAEKPVSDFEPILERCEQMGIQILTMDDEFYPHRLLRLDDAPAVLYCTGHPELVNGDLAVGMIGSRRPSEYGVEAAEKIGRSLARQGVVIVSGMADGLDSLCHRAALKENAPTAAFLGTAINKTYPAVNRDLRCEIEATGAVFSEFGPYAPTNKGSFLARNRLIAGSSDALCVVEARLKSGTMNTVSHAQRYGRPVFAVPGPIFSSLSEGTNQLLESGTAKAAPGAGSILAELGFENETQTQDRKTQEPRPVLSPAAESVLSRLTQTPRSIEALLAEGGMPPPTMLSALMELELAGFAVSCAGGQYRRK